MRSAAMAFRPASVNFNEYAWPISSSRQRSYLSSRRLRSGRGMATMATMTLAMSRERSVPSESVDLRIIPIAQRSI